MTNAIKMLARGLAKEASKNISAPILSPAPSLKLSTASLTLNTRGRELFQLGAASLNTRDRELFQLGLEVNGERAAPSDNKARRLMTVMGLFFQAGIMTYVNKKQEERQLLERSGNQGEELPTENTPITPKNSAI